MNKRKLIIVGAVLAIIFGSFGAMKFLTSLKPEPPAKSTEKVVRYVAAQKVKYATLKSEIIAQGRVNTSSELDIISEANGKIQQGSVILKKGSKFNKGDLICQIYKDEMLLNLKAQKSGFLNAVAGILPDLKIDYPKHYQSFMAFFNAIDPSKSLPELPQISDSKLKVFLASRNILANYYSIAQNELALSRHSIYAPFDGAITQVNMEVGAFANVGARIAKIINTQNLELEVPVNNADSKWIRIGNKVKVSSTGREKSWNGTISRIADFVDVNTQARSVFISINNPQGDVLSGEYLSASFNTVSVKNVMELPRNAVFNQNEVFLVENDKLKKAIVNVVKVNSQTILFNGIKEGEMIVSEPLINAQEGSLVKLLD